MIILISYFLAAVLISFLCSLLESVLLSLSHAHIAVLIKEKKRAGILMKNLKDRINRPLAAILTINTIANTVGAAGVGAQTFNVFGSAYVAVVSAVLTLTILFFSEIIPKTIGTIYNKSLVGFTAYVIQILIWITFPFVLVSENLSLLMKKDDEESSKASREELIAMAEISEDEGSIDEQEGDIIENLMKLDNITAEEVMTPRSVVFCLSRYDTVKDVVENHYPLVFSRIPVFQDDLDNIVGFVHRYDIVLKHGEDNFNIKIEKLMEPVHNVNEKRSISNILDDFVKRRQQIFIVSNDFGTTTGLITLEDAIETLLGVEIVDEHDRVVDMRKLAASKARVDKRS